jgi:hypothetical protein
MQVFYSASVNSFFSPAIHGDAIPPDAVEIGAEEHAALLAEQAAGKLIQADGDGKPFAAEPPASETIVRTLKSDIWRRCTDEEAEALEAALNAAPVRLRRLFNDSTILESNWPEYEALRSGIVQAVGEERAAELLAASQA